MTTQHYMANRYLAVRDDVCFHHFGRGCIADYNSNTIAFLDYNLMEIVLLCNRIAIMDDVIHAGMASLGEPRDFIESRIHSLIKKGVIVTRRKAHPRELTITGEPGYYYPKELVIELTDICNYCCPFCYKNANQTGIYMSDKTFAAVYKNIERKVGKVLLTGGEPTLHPNYLKYIDVLSKFAEVHMITNGSVIYLHDPAMLRKLDKVQFSVYGTDNEDYKEMTGAEHGFDNLCASIEVMRRHAINFSVAVTLCDRTIPKVKDFVETAITLGAKSLRIGFADAFGRGEHLFDNPSSYLEHRSDAYKTILEIKKNYRDKIFIELPNINVSHVENHDDILRFVHRGSLCCGCGSEYLVVSSRGKIRPCQMLPESIFSVEENDAFSKHICGNFHTEELNTAVKKYFDIHADSAEFLDPCEGLENFRNRNIT